MTLPPWLPRSFVELHEAGRFDYWGAPRSSLTPRERQQRLLARETQVLWWDHIHWRLSFDEIVSFSGDGILRPGLFPFAGNAAGDRYCWYPRWQRGQEPPVLFVARDEQECGVFAGSLAECLCRCFLQHFECWDEDADMREPGRPTRDVLWDAHLAILRPHLDETQLALLSEVDRHSPLACREADQSIESRQDPRRLVANQPPTQYNDAFIRKNHPGGQATLLRLYDESIAFYRMLIEVEGHVELLPKLEAARKARAAAELFTA